MSNPFPKLTLRVKTYDPVELTHTLVPDSDKTNIIRQLENQTVWFPYWPNALKHGDEFSLYGQKAFDTYKNLSQYNAAASMVEIIFYGQEN
jgi:hypothetical protein